MRQAMCKVYVDSRKTGVVPSPVKLTSDGTEDNQMMIQINGYIPAEFR